MRGRHGKLLIERSHIFSFKQKDFSLRKEMFSLILNAFLARTQPVFVHSKSTMETPEQCVKSSQS